MRVSYSRQIFQKNENFEGGKKKIKKYKKRKKKKRGVRYESPSGNQVDGLPLALHKDAESASWLWSGRACDHKI